MEGGFITDTQVIEYKLHILIKEIIEQFSLREKEVITMLNEELKN